MSKESACISPRRRNDPIGFLQDPIDSRQQRRDPVAKQSRSLARLCNSPKRRGRQTPTVDLAKTTFFTHAPVTAAAELLPHRSGSDVEFAYIHLQIAVNGRHRCSCSSLCLSLLHFSGADLANVVHHRLYKTLGARKKNILFEDAPAVT